MAKNVNNLVSYMNSKKEPTKREISRKMDVYRKRLRRARTKMEKRISSGEFKTKEEVKAAEKYIGKIEKAIETSYAIKKGYRYSLEHYEETTNVVRYRVSNEIYASIDKKNEDTSKTQANARGEIDARKNLEINDVIKDANLQMRKNLQFQRELAQARIEGGISELSSLEVSAFYRATQSIWEGENLINRNVAIMKYFNVDSLEEAFKIVLNDEEVKEDIERIKKLSGNVDNTKEKMGGKDKDEEDWKYDNRIIGIISSRTFTKRR